MNIDNFAPKIIMYSASFNDVLEVILWLVLIYYGIKFFFKFFGAAILRFILKRVGKKFEQQFTQNSTSPSSHQQHVGETIIDKKPTKHQKNTNKEAGEYIDFEEID